MDPISTAEDRISQLPDSILHLILSEDSTRHAVQTMVLSKRWERLWASTPYLFLDDYKDDFDSSVGMPNFIHFVNAVLLSRDMLAVHTFCLTWYFSYDKKWLTIWTNYVIRHNVKVLEIDLDIGDIDMEKWPSCIFTCQSVEKLTLKLKDSVNTVSMDLSPPEIVRLDHLRQLHLECSSVDHDSLKKLLGGCPVLEELVMDFCVLDDLDIISHTLKKLTIINCDITGTMNRISCPNLLDLVFLCNYVESQNIVLEDLSSLVAANIQTDDHGHGHIDSPFLRYLSFSDFLTERNTRSPSSPPSRFREVKKLVLSGEYYHSALAIIFFLRRVPNLELLKVRSPTYDGDGCTWRYMCSHFVLEIECECAEDDEQYTFELLTKSIDVAHRCQDRG